MKHPKTLPAFTARQKQKAYELLATKVAFMMGRKFEEGDWAQVYCAAKNIPLQGWSNLNIDIVHDGLGVEHKMLRPNGDKLVREVFGSQLMHPSATRSIRIDASGKPNTEMRSVLGQYAELLTQRRELVKQEFPNCEPDMRTGWLLWQTNLHEFVYFEEETVIPDPKDYVAEWHENRPKGGRKPSRSLWIYEKETRRKRYSVTTSAGAKVQPYFDVPPQSDPHVYLFRVQGEEYKTGFVRVWLPAITVRELRQYVGNLSEESLRIAVETMANQAATADATSNAFVEMAEPISLLRESYELLGNCFPDAVSDAHRFQFLVESLRGAKS